MSSLTDFLKLIKPDKLEKFTRTVFNGNMDAIDSGIKAIEDRGTGIIARKRQDTSSPTVTASAVVISSMNNVKFRGGRSYEITIDTVAYVTDPSTYFSIDFGKGLVTDTEASTVYTSMGRGSSFSFKTASSGETRQHTVIYPCPADETVFFKVASTRVAGSGSHAHSNLEWWIKDVGKTPA